MSIPSDVTNLTSLSEGFCQLYFMSFSWEVCKLSFTPMDLFDPKPWSGHEGSANLQDMSGTA